MSEAGPDGPSQGEAWRRRRRNAAARVRGRRLLRRGLRFLLALSWPLPLPLAMLLGEAGGLLAWALSGTLRRRAREQMRDALGDALTDAERRRAVRRIFLDHGRSLAEVLVARRKGVAFLETLVSSVEGEERMPGPEGPAVLIVTGHIGNFEMLATWLARRTRLKVVGRAAREGDTTDMIEEIRAGFGVETLSQKNPRGILRALRDGTTVGLLPDQDIDKLDGIFVPFFGKDAYTPSGPASMAVATNTPLLPLVILREGRSRHRIVIHEPIPPRPDAPEREEEVRRLTLAWTAVLEKEIAARPDQWVWYHRRWQTTPGRLERVRARRARVSARRS